jgi:hypothetical protein
MWVSHVKHVTWKELGAKLITCGKKAKITICRKPMTRLRMAE